MILCIEMIVSVFRLVLWARLVINKVIKYRYYKQNI